MGSFPTKSRPEILPRCRRDYPLPPPINRGSVDDLREKKIERKVGRKPAFPAQFSCKQPLLFFLSPPWSSATTTIITHLLTVISTSSNHQNITRSGCTISISLSSMKLFSPATATQEQQQQQPPRLEAFDLPKDRQDSSSLLSRSNSSNCELPFSFADVFFSFFQLQSQPTASLTTSSRTFRHQSGRQLLQRQVSLPLLFFFFLSSLSWLHVNSATWINSRCTVPCNLVTGLPVTKLLRAGPALAQPSWLGRVQPVPKMQKKCVGPSPTQPFWAYHQHLFLGLCWAQPTCFNIFNYLI